MWHPFKKAKIVTGEKSRARKPRERFRDIAIESELFLTGRYADHLISRGLPVPDWAWLNVLAHSPARSIATIAQREPPVPTRRCNRRCDQSTIDQVLDGKMATRYLAGELLRCSANEGRRIEDIQRNVLVNLELELAHTAEEAASGITGTLSPAQLIVRVLSTLDNPLNHRTP